MEQVKKHLGKSVDQQVGYGAMMAAFFYAFAVAGLPALSYAMEVQQYL